LCWDFFVLAILSFANLLRLSSQGKKKGKAFELSGEGAIVCVIVGLIIWFGTQAGML